jgi:hypothetical protein
LPTGTGKRGGEKGKESAECMHVDGGTGVDSERVQGSDWLVELDALVGCTGGVLTGLNI